MTLLGVFFIPVTLACFLWRPARLLPLLVIASIFEAGSVFNGAVGNFVYGVPPFYLVEICVAIRLLMRAWEGGALLPPGKTPARAIAVLLLIFLAWSFASSFVMPRLFAGMPVISPRERVDVDIVLGNLAPLQWSLSNFGQAFYLTLNVAAALYALLVVQMWEQAEALGRALRWAVLLVVAAGLLQYLLPLAGGSYPYSVFNNNPNRAVGSQTLDEQIDDLTRISSTFAEPMNSGSFLAAAATGLLAGYLRGQRGIRDLLLLLAVVFVLLQTTSTTGYVALLVMLFPLLVYFNPLAQRQLEHHPPFLKGWTFVVLGALGAAGMGLALIPGLSAALVVVTVDKSEGMSFLSRVVADQQSFAMFTDTYGLGVGLGSNRPSSLVMTLLSTVGIVGTTLFAMLLFRIVRLFPGKCAPVTLQMSFWALAGLLVASLGVPDINRPGLWALLIVATAQLNVYRRVSTGQVLVP